ncbi:hypothetical protein SLEP1_g35598 [Rubroshorea leprosula]|uniref:Secreted protein n=1 Tax=Rubroshorea leprosula TaxID=152421 RepID=A0AAV5KNS8_9ROSI|nr:hypothetical protein SLEP1_g35598 [Rubroshorea leprosula]
MFQSLNIAWIHLPIFPSGSGATLSLVFYIHSFIQTQKLRWQTQCHFRCRTEENQPFCFIPFKLPEYSTLCKQKAGNGCGDTLCRMDGGERGGGPA